MESADRAGGLCRALSLPLDENDHDVIFKSAPAAWKHEQARRTGFCPPRSLIDGSAPTTTATTAVASAAAAAAAAGEGAGAPCSSREDDWVKVGPWLVGGGDDDAGGRKAGGTCVACGGFGCSWCREGGGGYSYGGGGQEEEEGLWEAALAPP